MYFWISWYQPTEDYRPLTFPPNASVLSYHCTGIRDSDNASTLVAMVKANSPDNTKEAVKKDWPEADEWRFIQEIKPLVIPGDRFPLKDWMEERYKSEGALNGHSD